MTPGDMREAHRFTLLLLAIGAAIVLSALCSDRSEHHDVSKFSAYEDKSARRAARAEVRRRGGGGCGD